MSWPRRYVDNYTGVLIDAFQNDFGKGQAQVWSRKDWVIDMRKYKQNSTLHI